MNNEDKVYRELQQHSSSLMQDLQNRANDFSLFSFIEKVAGQADVKENIAYMKPSETGEGEAFSQVMVEMKLQMIGLKQLVDFLKEIESPENIVALQRVSIQENKKQESTLDVVLQVVSIKNIAGGQN